jgi:hypothetical protein
MYDFCILGYARGAFRLVSILVSILKELRQAVGEIGCYVIPTQEWADSAATRRSYELFARYVIPHCFSQTASLHRAADEFTAITNAKPGPAVTLTAGKTRIDDVVATG